MPRPPATGSAPAVIARAAERILGEIVGWDRCPEAEPDRSDHQPSIHHVLRARLDRHAAGDPSALAPGPEVDRTLRRLVALVTACHGDDGAPSVAARHRLHLDVVAAVGRRLDDDPVARARAAEVGHAAAVAETAMEHHYARLALRRAPLRSDPATGDRLTRLHRFLAPFPYGANYEKLTRGELAGLRAAGAGSGAVAFCGAGALPLTGILLHILTDAAVTLFEIEPETAALATRLCRRLEADGILAPEAVTVTAADAATLDPTRFRVVVAASLLSRATVAAVAARVAAVAPGPTRPVLAVRSAAGLTGWFVYPSVPPGDPALAGLRHLGTVAPLTGVAFDGAPVESRVAVPFASPTLLAVTSPSVLNRTEVLA